MISKKILLLEDDPSLSALLRIKLEKNGYTVNPMYLGAEAFDFLIKNPEWVLLSDFRLPDMSCIDLITMLQNAQIQVNFIVITGHGDQELAVEMMKKGALDYIVKNVGFIENLPAIVNRVFEILEMRSKLEEQHNSIKENEHKLRMFFDSIQDIFFVANSLGIITEISKSVYEILGYHPQDLIGKPISSVFYNIEDYLVLKDTLSKKLSIRNNEFLVLHNDGTAIYVSVSCNMVSLNNDKAYSIIGLAQDISMKKQLEAYVIKKVMEAEEKERRKIAESIHDDIGPMMSTIKMYFELISVSNDDNEKRKKLLGKISEIIDSTIQKTRGISNNLMPNVLETFGLEKAVKSFVEKLSFAVNIKFDINITFIQISNTVEILLYRTAIELINNSIKHANASEIVLNIIQTEIELIFIYSDNGMGFDPKILETPEKLKGQGMLSLLDRITLFSGKCTIKTAIGSGFLIKIVFDNKLI